MCIEIFSSIENYLNPDFYSHAEEDGSLGFSIEH